MNLIYFRDDITFKANYKDQHSGKRRKPYNINHTRNYGNARCLENIYKKLAKFW